MNKYDAAANIALFLLAQAGIHRAIVALQVALLEYEDDPSPRNAAALRACRDVLNERLTRFLRTAGRVG